ncbi:MAG: BamA/TamA family outer membrane protein [Bacteroidota bacterium]|nr:BamA/TamA family outer membrane protein [Bacteroidota bacterium]
MWTDTLAQTQSAVEEWQAFVVEQDIPLTGAMTRYEVDEIIFVGNTAFPSELLAALITSRASEAHIGRRVARYMLRELQRNPASPKELHAIFRKVEQNASASVRYFDRVSAAADTAAIAMYYRQHGFHRVQVEYAFFRNPQTQRNSLIFHIVEHNPTPLDTIVYYGLEHLDPDLLPKLQALQTLQRGMRFSQSAVTQQNERILALLRDNGYYAARYRKPIVSFIEHENRDSVTVFFDIGKRKRIGSIEFVDSSASYTYVSPRITRALVELRVGDWYSEAALVRSVNNLYNFGLFDVALIDTVAANENQTDSTLALRVLTRVRRIHTTDMGGFIGQIANTTILESGLNARYENRNLLGEGQTLSVQAQIAFVDINTLVNNLLVGNAINARIEGLLSGRFAYPFIAKLYNQRLDLEAQVSYSVQSLAFVSLASPLLLETGKLYVSLPLLLSQRDIVNHVFLEVNFDRQRPINFDSTYAQALRLVSTDAERTIVEQQLFQYRVLSDLYNQVSTPFLTSTILTLGARGDHRDNPFNPHKGYFLECSVDGALPLGASEFVRVAGDIRWFEELSKQSVVAARVRAGHIILLNPLRVFVPIERQFFAGGSNSVRGWNVRELRYSTKEFAGTLSTLGFVGQFIGSGSLVEGSVEWRYSIAPEFNEYGSFIERQLSKLGIAWFLDVGNAFNSFLEPPEHYGRVGLPEVAQNLAIASGIGLRYDTSVGPFRVDVAMRLYDPSRQTWLFQVPNLTLSQLAQQWLNIQIGLGHTF